MPDEDALTGKRMTSSSLPSLSMFEPPQLESLEGADCETIHMLPATCYSSQAWRGRLGQPFRLGSGRLGFDQLALHLERVREHAGADTEPELVAAVLGRRQRGAGALLGLLADDAAQELPAQEV